MSGYVANDGKAYETFIGRWSRRVADRIAEIAPPPFDGAVLDVGCGTGSLAAAFATRFPEKHIFGIDLSESYLDFARERPDCAGVTFLHQDATAPDLPDAEFAAAYALISLNFMSDPAKAMAAMVQAVVPGGLIAACAWDFRGGLTYQRLLWDTAAGIDPAAAATRDKIFSNPLALPDGMSRLLSQAGLANVTRQSVTIRMDFDDFDDYWLPLLGGQGPVGSYVLALEPDLAQRVRDAVRLAYLSGDIDGPRSLTATAWLVTGIVPEDGKAVIKIMTGDEYGSV
jgi:ubiquinone/menaquinone biosynthesis C-methylase UbiE